MFMFLLMPKRFRSQLVIRWIPNLELSRMRRVERQEEACQFANPGEPTNSSVNYALRSVDGRNFNFKDLEFRTPNSNRK